MTSLKIKALAVLVVMLVVGVTVSVRQIILDRQQIQNLTKTPEQQAKEETQNLIKAVSKLVLLPDNETPIVATVNDKEQLKDQPVFAKAENGDKILVYTGAKKAYIYSPSRNKIVDVVAVNLEQSASQVVGASTENPARLALYNGSINFGVTGVLEKRLKDNNVAGIQVVSKEAAKKADYPKTELIDLTGKFPDQAKQLAMLLNAAVVNLPSNEATPNADLLVIIGADFK